MTRFLLDTNAASDFVNRRHGVFDRVEQQGLKPKDLVPYIGSKSKASEVLSGRRPLSLSMIRRLVAGLHLPAEVAIRVTKSPRVRRAKPKPARRRLPAAGGR